MISSTFIKMMMLLPVLAQGPRSELKDFMNSYQKFTGRNRTRDFGGVLRISGGFEVTPKFKYPFMTFIRLEGYSDAEYICGGTMLDKLTLLTSAHCVTEDYTKYFRAHIHRHDKTKSPKDEQGAVHVFRKVVTHEHYSVNSKQVSFNDIALVRLNTPTSNMKFVRLPSADLGDPPTDVELSIAGWGLTSSSSAQSSKLEEATELHLTNSCFTSQSGLTKQQHLCAKGDLSADACTNDSGGPLLAPATDGGFIQIGIISSGNKCGATGAPGVYTRVLGQLDWIQSARKTLYSA